MKQWLTVTFLFSFGICVSQDRFSFSDSAVLSRLSRDIHVLASDSFAGRKSGTGAEQKASRYIINCFREAGLTSTGAAESSFLQPFPIVSFTIPRDSNTLSIDGFQGKILLRQEFCPTAYSASGLVKGNRYILIDLSKYISPDKSIPGDTVAALREAIRNAFRQGYQLVFVFNEELLDLDKRHALYNREKINPDEGLVISVNSEIASYLQEHPGANVLALISVRRSAIICHNIIGFINNEAQYTVIIGAHYDHMGISKEGKVFNGADDNASGTAMMMELARYLKQSGEKGENYLFIAFSGEEEGLYGSEYFVGHPTVDMNTINFMVNLDMIGRLGCEGNRVNIFGTGTSPSWRELYKKTPHPGFRICRMHGVHAFTDHVGFYQHGIPIISMTTGFHYEYHTTRDKPETINYPGMVDLAKYLEGLLHQSMYAGKVGFHKVPLWYDMSANFKIIIKDIDHIMAVGMEQ